MIRKIAQRASMVFFEKTEKGLKFRAPWWFYIIFVVSLIVMSKTGVFDSIAKAVSKIIHG